MKLEEKQVEEAKLLAMIQKQIPELTALWETVSDHWGYEDHIYRFYHQSFKVFGLQSLTLKIIEALQHLAPHLSLNAWFMQIVSDGTGREFSTEMNERWLEVTRPIVEAFLHARYFLEMVCKYGKELTEPPQSLPSGWAAVLELYGLR
jgi:hypothetical protein